MKSCAILIDFWKECNLLWVVDVVTKIHSIDCIGTVILASYDVTDDDYFQSTPWQTTAQYELARKFDQHVGLTHDKYFQETHPDLLNYKFINKEQYRCTYPFELVDLPFFETVYIFGQSYEDCVVNRPLGIKYWKNEANVRVLALENSIHHSNNSSVHFNHISYWKKIDSADHDVNCWELTKNL